MDSVRKAPNKRLQTDATAYTLLCYSLRSNNYTMCLGAAEAGASHQGEI